MQGSVRTLTYMKTTNTAQTSNKINNNKTIARQGHPQHKCGHNACKSISNCNGNRNTNMITEPTMIYKNNFDNRNNKDKQEQQ